MEIDQPRSIVPQPGTPLNKYYFNYLRTIATWKRNLRTIGVDVELILNGWYSMKLSYDYIIATRPYERADALRLQQEATWDAIIGEVNVRGEMARSTLNFLKKMDEFIIQNPELLVKTLKVLYPEMKPGDQPATTDEFNQILIKPHHPTQIPFTFLDHWRLNHWRFTYPNPSKEGKFLNWEALGDDVKMAKLILFLVDEKGQEVAFGNAWTMHVAINVVVTDHNFLAMVFGVIPKSKHYLFILGKWPLLTQAMLKKELEVEASKKLADFINQVGKKRLRVVGEEETHHQAKRLKPAAKVVDKAEGTGFDLKTFTGIAEYKRRLPHPYHYRNVTNLYNLKFVDLKK